MKHISNLIDESMSGFLVSRKSAADHKYAPKTKKELRSIIKDRIKREGNECDLNDIDISGITDLSELFRESSFNGDISKWDTSNTESMGRMFYESKSFNGDISSWDVSNVKDMHGMFFGSFFNGDISEWDVHNVENMNSMFSCSDFNGDISKWDVSNVTDMNAMFRFSNFRGDISRWDVSKVENHSDAFNSSPIDGKRRKQPKFKN